MWRRVRFVLVAASFAALTGCVEQKFVIQSNPPGATVFRNGKDIGVTPVDDHWVYPGKYHFTLVKDGYATQEVVQDVPPRWYQYFPLDFVAEVLIPWKIQDIRTFEYALEPMQTPRTDHLLNRAETLRGHGHSLGAPGAAPVPNAPRLMPPADVATPPP